MENELELESQKLTKEEVIELVNYGIAMETQSEAAIAFETQLELEKKGE
ncbi:hypothetical protein [Helicobacter sp. 11S03491-1]|nr:hypothetical protein [Helicobacter sp. 11S03491-1]